MLFYHLLLAASLSLATAQQSELDRPCGFKIAPCPEDMHCVADNPYCSNLNKCPGHCEFKNKYPHCGGFTPYPVVCDQKSECKDDPRLPDSCGMACDAPGICIPKKKYECRGFLGKECPKGLYCYDELDDCDPRKGGADCIGICL